MAQQPLAVARIDEEIEDLVDQRLIAQADRSAYRVCVDACTARMRWIRDRIAELEQARQLLLHPGVVVAT